MLTDKHPKQNLKSIFDCNPNTNLKSNPDLKPIWVSLFIFFEKGWSSGKFRNKWKGVCAHIPSDNNKLICC